MPLSIVESDADRVMGVWRCVLAHTMRTYLILPLGCPSTDVIQSNRGWLPSCTALHCTALRCNPNKHAIAFAAKHLPSTYVAHADITLDAANVGIAKTVPRASLSAGCWLWTRSDYSQPHPSRDTSDPIVRLPPTTPLSSDTRETGRRDDALNSTTSSVGPDRDLCQTPAALVCGIYNHSLSTENPTFHHVNHA